jgi:hypothetical protein
MDRINYQLSLAPPNCEYLAKKMFPLDMSPEEYAARYSEDWFCFSFNRYRYRDIDLDQWIQRLGEIFSDPQLLAQCKEKMISRQKIIERLNEDFSKD